MPGATPHGCQLRMKRTCKDCCVILKKPSQAPKKQLILQRDNKDGLHNPPKDLVTVYKYAERVCRTFLESNLSAFENLLDTLCEETESFLKNEDIFIMDPHVSPNEEASHFSQFLKIYLTQFFTARIHHFLETKSDFERGLIVRQKLTKLILFLGQ